MFRWWISDADGGWNEPKPLDKNKNPLSFHWDAISYFNSNADGWSLWRPQTVEPLSNQSILTIITNFVTVFGDRYKIILCGRDRKSCVTVWMGGLVGTRLIFLSFAKNIKYIFQFLFYQMLSPFFSTLSQKIEHLRGFH